MADLSTTALLLVDIQPDFMPGGPLAVAQGDAILAPVRALMESDRFGVCVATQDWHPPGHVSFASSHSGRRPMERIDLYGHEQTLWPDHCVQDTPGAALHDDLPWARAAAVIRKGMDPAVDSYSGFRNNWNAAGERPPTGLAGYLRERGIDTVCLAGLARDVCVRFTALDAAAAGFRTRVMWELTRSVDPGADATVKAQLRGRGVELVYSELP